MHPTSTPTKDGLVFACAIAVVLFYLAKQGSAKLGLLGLLSQAQPSQAKPGHGRLCHGKLSLACCCKLRVVRWENSR